MAHSIAVDENLELRLLQEEDADELFAVAEKNRAELERWVPSWAHATTSLDACRSVIRHSLQRHAVGSGRVLGIRSDHHLVGLLGLSVTAPWEGEIGYWLGVEHRGRGIATRCVQAFTDYVFDSQRLSVLRIVCDPQNLPACAIPERLGFELQSAVSDSPDESSLPRTYVMTPERWTCRGFR